MRIAFLSRYQNSISRGAETYVSELSSRLEKGHEVEILSGNEADSFQRIISGKYDVIFSINGRMQSLKASLGRFFGNYKLIIPGESGIGADSIWNLLVKPDAFIALTQQMANWAGKWSWGSKVVKIPNGVDTDKFQQKGKTVNLGLTKPIVLSVGALSWYKHHERTIEAVSRLKNLSLLIVGEGEEKDRLEDLADEKIRGRYKITNADYNQLPAIYRSAQLFCLPSWRREAFGIVYLEAMASGLGIVAPDDLVRREIIGEAGILIDVSSPDNYAKGIERALRIDWKRNARKQAEKFSWNKIVFQYEKLLNDISQR